MKRFTEADRTGMAVSLVVHAAVLLLLWFMTPAPIEKQPIGFLEVEFGPISEGRPVQQAPERPVPQEADDPEPEEVEETPPAAPPEEAKPVDLPEQTDEIASEDVVENVETDVIAPEKATTQEEVVDEDPQPEREIVRPLGSGAIADDSADASGDAGTGSDEQVSAPFQIEGLNRSPVATPLPAYAEQVNALIRVRITVNPQGRIIERIPLIKGNPTLEQSVMDALLRWQFNPLPPNAPQENQTGVISFRFRLQ